MKKRIISKFTGLTFYRTSDTLLHEKNKGFIYEKINC